MPTLLNDLRYALRQLRRSPGFAATAILTLALGIGATTAIFTLVYQVMLRSMPVRHPEQLYKVGQANCGGCVTNGLQDDWNLFSTDLYRYLRDETPGTAGMIATESRTDNVSVRKAGDHGAAQALTSRYVSGNYFSVLGVEPYAGRLLRPEDDREGAPPVAAISYALWRSRFAADPRIVGSTLLLSGHPVTVVGIAAPGFLGERNQPDAAGLWLPIAAETSFDHDSPLNHSPASHWLNLLVRIPDASRVAPLQGTIAGELRQWIRANRGLFSDGPPTTDAIIARQTTELGSASGGINDLREQYGASLKLLLWVAGFVLLIACANLANLLLVRGMARKQELAVRSALGAPRSRLVWQTLVEALLIALFGGLAAVLVAYAGTRGILALAMRGVQQSSLSALPSLPVLLFALLVSLVTGVLFGMAPAWIGSRSSPVEALRAANRSTRDASAVQRMLVIGQAALSLVLLSTAGLLVTSLRHLEHQDFRFEPEGRLLVSTDLSAAGYQYRQLAGLYRQFDDAFARLPGIESFAYATYGPMTDTNWNSGIYLPGVELHRGKNSVAGFSAVSADYFATVGTRVLQGLGMTRQDSEAGTRVAVVNQAFARHFLKGNNPVGQHFGTSRSTPGEFEIVGVVEDTKYGNPSEPVRPMYFTPIAQFTPSTDSRGSLVEEGQHYAGNLIFRYRGDESTAAASVRRALQAINPDLPILKMQSYTDQLGDQFTQQELVVRLTTLFGLLALLLASIGLYGVTAYAVARRTSEIGIRMALGASRGGVLAMVVRGALSQALIGLLLGLPLCFVAAKLLAGTLYQTGSFQPFVLLTVAALLLLSAFAAALIPARRAASIDPMRALRTE